MKTLALLLMASGAVLAQDKKKIVLVAGGNSHGYGDHEHFAGSTLFAKLLNENVPGVNAVVVKGGWPKDESVFDGAAAVVIYSDGGGGHPAMKHLDVLDSWVKKGIGVGCIHYAVEIPKGKSGDAFLDAIGGYFEMNWSVNPHWTADFKEFPKHAVTSGVKPFKTNDEWYYNMRFREKMEGVTPILTAVPPDSTRKGKDSTHGGNEFVRTHPGQAEHVMWTYQRADGGRGFGLTGGHVHWNWADDNQRKLVLNSIVWIAKIDVPADGVASKTPTREELELNIEKPKPGEKKK